MPLLLQLEQLFSPLRVQTAHPGVHAEHKLLVVVGVELTCPYWPEGQEVIQLVPERKYVPVQKVHRVAETVQRAHGAVQLKQI